MTKRLYVESVLSQGKRCPLSSKMDHYVRHVLRLRDGEEVCAFNKDNGAWRAFIRLEKRTSFLQCVDYLSPPLILPPLGLAFCPLKPERLFFLIEKATELGVTDFFPLQTDYTQGHLKLNPEKIKDQMIASIQQCERFDLPLLHESQSVQSFLKTMITEKWHLSFAVERLDTPLPSTIPNHLFPCLMVGPEGGWSTREKGIMEDGVRAYPTSMQYLHLGQTILRSETAAIAGLVLLKHHL